MNINQEQESTRFAQSAKGKVEPGFGRWQASGATRYTSAYAMFSNRLGVIFGLPEFPIMTCVDVVSGIKIGTKITDAAPLKAVPRIKVPVLFIHGAADTLVPPAMMEELFATCKVKKEKLIIEGAGHGDAMVTDRGKYCDCVLNF